ncbi:hypothetical protein RC83_12795 [Pectobacterium brasiliense]|nr:hypothetical protein RC83_12795 [Pectobacterium brasiliense]
MPKIEVEFASLLIDKYVSQIQIISATLGFDGLRVQGVCMNDCFCLMCANHSQRCLVMLLFED